MTLTLPQRTLNDLQRIDPDRGQAIVKLVRAALRSTEARQSGVEISEMAPGTGLLVVGPSEALRRIPFLHLVEVAPARYLLALDRGNDFKALELAILDAMEDLPDEESDERVLLSDLLKHIRNLRKSESVKMAEILVVKLDRKKS